MRSVDSECTEASLFGGVSSAETTTETAALGGCHQERHGWNGSSADGPEVVWGVRLRTTSGVVRGWRLVVPDGQRSKAIGVSAGREKTPWSAARPRSAVVQ